jgi:hypothetical protein
MLRIIVQQQQEHSIKSLLLMLHDAMTQRKNIVLFNRSLTHSLNRSLLLRQ